MNKKMCFMIFIAAVVVVIAGFLFNIGIIKSVTRDIFADMSGFYACASGVLLGILLAKNKYYWLLLLPCALLAAVLIQFFVVGSISSLYAILIRTAAVMAYGYLTALIRFMI